jgi:phosphotriesterase-related protein
MGRDLDRLVRLARASGVTIIAGTGWYVGKGHPPELAATPTDRLADAIVADLTEAAPSSGVIGEIGISREDVLDEWRVLDASLQASARTGAPVWIHQTTTEPMRRILDRLARDDVARDGLDRSRIVLCHTDYDLRDIALHREAMALGITVELDLFGMPIWNRRNWVHAPDDTLRTERLIELATAGHAHQLLISQDVCMKIQQGRFGGFGYGHLLAHVRELFDTLGGEPTDWDTITRTNPARLLAWAPA